MLKKNIVLILIMLLGVAGVAQAATPIFEYSFPDSYDGTGSTVTDLSGAGNNVTLDSADVALVDDRPAGFDASLMSITGANGGHGATAAIDLLDNASVAAAGGFTMDCWFQWEGTYTNIRKLIDYAGTEALRTLDGQIQFILSDGGSVLGMDIAANTWYHVVGVFDTQGNSPYPGAYGSDYDIDGVMSLYVDDVLIGSQPGTKTGFGDQLNRPMSINRWAGGGADWYQGLNFNPRVYLGVKLGNPDAPELVYPLNSDSPTPWDLTLKWLAPEAYTPGGHYVYLDPNEANVTAASQGSAPDPLIVNAWDTEDPNQHPVTGLEPGETYYWKVEARRDDSPDPNWFSSIVETFTTLPITPVITTDIVNQTVPLNAVGIEFTVEAQNVEPGDPDDGYQWYKDGQILPGETSNTLAFTPSVTLGDEGYYHCVAYNEAGDKSSKIARLVTERLLAHWEFESSNLNDTAPGGYHNGTIFPIGGDPNFVAGIVGAGAIQFDHDQHEAMIVPRDPNLVLDNFTVSLWAKIDAFPGGHQAVVSFRDDSPTRGYILYAAPADKWEYWTGPGSGWDNLGSGEPLTDVIAGAWTHLAISYEQTGYEGANLTGTKRLYVNGKLAATATDITLSWTDIATDLQIGAGENASTTHNFFFDGAVDDVQLFTYALDPVTIAQMYNTVTGEVICVDGRPQYDIVPSTDDPSDPSYCIVDLRDFADWASHWLDCNRVPDCLP